jgi:hypothetical protein
MIKKLVKYKKILVTPGKLASTQTDMNPWLMASQNLGEI